MKQAKNIEPQVANLLIKEYNLTKEKYQVDTELSSLDSFSKKIADNIITHLSNEGLPVIDVSIKPKVEGETTYGSRVEPKTDLVLVFSSGESKTFSLKKDTETSYIHSSNNVEDSFEIFLGGGLDSEITAKLKGRIKEVFPRVLSKESNFDAYDRKKGSLENFIDYYNKPEKIISWVGEEKYQESRKAIIRMYQEVSTSGLRPYRTLLHSRESEVQSLFEDIFRNEENEDYAKKILFELLTGTRKFGKDSLACAGYIANSDGVFKIDFPSCEYVTILLNHFRSSEKIGRLQNVPRNGNSRKDFMLEDVSEIARRFPTADLTIKI